jgi:hypothetical protein
MNIQRKTKDARKYCGTIAYYRQWQTTNEISFITMTCKKYLIQQEILHYVDSEQ